MDPQAFKQGLDELVNRTAVTNKPSTSPPAIASPPSTDSRPRSKRLSEETLLPTKRRRGRTPSTLISSAVSRQWEKADDLGYEKLLEARRRERVSNVDRYVPQPRDRVSYKPGSLKQKQASSGMTLSKLPDNILDEICKHALVKPTGPIKIDHGWLLPFVHHRAVLPPASKVIKVDGQPYHITVPQANFQAGVDRVIKVIQNAGDGLMKFAQRERSDSGLAISLLRTSRAIHSRAARVFYGSNTFHFPRSDSAWLELESFLCTIGPINRDHLSNIRIHAPMWNRGIKADFLTGAVLDALNPATRMAIIRQPASDRLLEAITNITDDLSMSGLERLEVDLLNPLHAEHWIGHASSDRYDLFDLKTAERHIFRKQRGVELIKHAFENLTRNPITPQPLSMFPLSPPNYQTCRPQKDDQTRKPERPVLKLYHPTPVTPPVAREFRQKLTAVIKEALQYGWTVDQMLHWTRER